MKDWRGTEIVEGSLVTLTINDGKAPALGVVIRLGTARALVRVLSSGGAYGRVTDVSWRNPDYFTVVGNYFDEFDDARWRLPVVEELEEIWHARVAKLREENLDAS